MSKILVIGPLENAASAQVFAELWAAKECNDIILVELKDIPPDRLPPSLAKIQLVDIKQAEPELFFPASKNYLNGKKLPRKKR